MQQNVETGVPVPPLSAIVDDIQQCRWSGEEPPLDDVLSLVASKRRQKQHSQLLWHLCLMIGDALLLTGLFFLVLLLVPSLHLQWKIFRQDGLWSTDLLCISFAVVLWSIATKVTQAYELLSTLNRFTSSFKVVFALTLTLFFWTILTTPLFVGDVRSSILAALLFLAFAIPCLSGWRIAFAEFMNLPRFHRQAVIVGATTAGKTIASEIHSTKRSHIAILGYIHDAQIPYTSIDEIPLLGDEKVLHALSQNRYIDTIISAIDHNVSPGLFRETIAMSHLGISVIPMAIAYENISGKIPVEHIGEQWYLSLPLETTVSPFYLFWRKVVDVLFGLVGTGILLLILPLLSLLIKLDSSGPIFYSQERMGIHGRPFRIYKFRSMHTDAEQEGHVQWANAKDDRVTRVGRIMRATHLDELPQVWNMLKGEMSLIGPRPERAEFVTSLEQTIPFYRYRLSIKPGLTGWAQVKYHYGNTDNDALIKLQYDLYYIKHQSFMLDIFIMLMTVIEMMLLRGI